MHGTGQKAGGAGTPFDRAVRRDSMSTNNSETQETDEQRYRNDTSCPICGDPYDDTTRMSERHREGNIETIPGVAYDHDRGGLCIEWADGSATSSGL